MKPFKSSKKLSFSLVCVITAIVVSLNVFAACEKDVAYEYKFINNSAEKVVIYCIAIGWYERLDLDFVSTYEGALYDSITPLVSVATLSPSETAVIRSLRTNDWDSPSYNHIFVFKESLLERYPMEELRERNLYSDYLIYEYKQLKKRNFTINYYGEAPR